MKRYLPASTVLILVVSLLFVSDFCVADEAVAPAVAAPAAAAPTPDAASPSAGGIDTESIMEEDEGLMYTYGTVVSVTQDAIVLNEYDFDSDSFKEVTYSVSPKVQWENIKAAVELAAGDSVEIYFTEEGGKKVAKTVGKDVEDSLDDADMEETDTDDASPAPKLDNTGMNSPSDASPAVETTK